MTPHHLEAQLREMIFASQDRPPAELDPERDLSEVLELDSLDGLELMERVESRFAVHFNDHELACSRTLGNMRAALEDASKRAAS